MLLLTFDADVSGRMRWEVEMRNKVNNVLLKVCILNDGLRYRFVNTELRHEKQLQMMMTPWFELMSCLLSCPLVLCCSQHKNKLLSILVLFCCWFLFFVFVLKDPCHLALLPQDMSGLQGHETPVKASYQSRVIERDLNDEQQRTQRTQDKSVPEFTGFNWSISTRTRTRGAQVTSTPPP